MKLRTTVIIVVLIITFIYAGFTVIGSNGTEQAQAKPLIEDKDYMQAPEFPKGLDWLNVDQPRILYTLAGILCASNQKLNIHPPIGIPPSPIAYPLITY